MYNCSEATPAKESQPDHLRASAVELSLRCPSHKVRQAQPGRLPHPSGSRTPRRGLPEWPHLKKSVGSTPACESRAFVVTRRNPLTPQEQRFVDEYLVDFKGGSAYRRVNPYVTEGSARSLAAALLTRLNIKNAVKMGRRRLRRDAHVHALTVILELSRLAFSDIGDILTINDDGTVTLRPGSQIPPEARRAIKSIEVKEPVTVGTGKSQKMYTPVKIVLYDKLAALEKLARHLGLYDAPTPADALLNALPQQLQAPVRAALATTLHGGPVPNGGHNGRRANGGDRGGTEAELAPPVPGGGLDARPVASVLPDEQAEADGASMLSPSGDSSRAGYTDPDNLGPLFDD